MLQKLIKPLAFLVISLIACLATITWIVSDWYESPIILEEPVVVEFSRGTALADLSWQLENLKVIDSSSLYHVWVRTWENYGAFQAGTYRFKGPTSPRMVSETITSGKTYDPIVLRFTIPEGFTEEKVINRLARLGVASKEVLWGIVRDEEFLRKHNIPGKSAEGFLYPATYHFRRSPSPKEVLSHIVNTFWSKLPENYIDQVEAKGLNLMEAVTFASLIQIETKFDDELPMVSEVIWRRLKSGSPIGIDAALIYGIENYQGDIKWQHLKDKNNPYNTRIHKGLPPTPIANPDINSLLAVLSPSNKGYNYYVVDASSKEGRHHFSKTYAEHKRYVDMLVRSNHGR